MRTDINELITLSYELEGLLLLALHRGDDTPRQVWHMIDAHIKSLANGVASELDSDDELNVAGEPEEQDEVPVYDADVNVSEIPDKPASDAESDLVAVAEATVAPEKPEISEVQHQPGMVEVPSTADDTDEDLTLDEKLARANSRCLRKAFSLNDRFRFRRELFGNSDAAITDTLDLVEAMRSIDEARDYFFDELEWDPENPEVKDFMEIVTKHFLSR